MFIRSLTLRNILSFREPGPLELRPLNILIGPNASGKSNLIDCIELLQALPNSLGNFINGHGGSDGWAWKGAKRTEEAGIKCEFELACFDRLIYEISFTTAEPIIPVLTETLRL